MSMRQHVTVVPSDRLIIVDGEALHFDFPAPAPLRALQWRDGNGHMEWTDDYNMGLDASLYAEEVAPWVALWEAEKTRRERKAAEDEAELNSFVNVRARAVEAVDRGTSAAILRGFDYEIDPGTGTPETLHFSYDNFDQQNFADSANVALLSLSGPKARGLPASVTWNAYRNHTPDAGGELVRLTLDPAAFLALYTGGALAHKAARMEEGGQRKAALEAAGSVEAVRALLAEWGL